MRTLLGHLAQFSSFSTQSEVLCTQGLTYLLENPEARAAIAEQIAAHAGVAVGGGLTWRAEVRQLEDSTRPDLEACTPDGKPVVKIEAKLGALLVEAQLRSYAADLHRRSGRGVLMVLVPAHRTSEAAEVVNRAFDVTGTAPWKPASYLGIAVIVTAWDEIVSWLEAVASEPFRFELAQLASMYRVLAGNDIEPLAGRDELLAWRERAGVFESLVDRVTRQLSGASRLLPMGVEALSGDLEGLDPVGYRRRFVCLPLGDAEPCFSIGARDPFAGHDTPIWMRFHKTTPRFALIRDRLRASLVAPRLVESGGHVWIPLDVPIGADGGGIVAALHSAAGAVIEVAYRTE